MIKTDSSGIKIEGHRGKWYVIDSMVRQGEWFFLLEHETYGEDAASLIVDASGRVIVDDVYDGFDELPAVILR